MGASIVHLLQALRPTPNEPAIFFELFRSQSPLFIYQGKDEEKLNFFCWLKLMRKSRSFFTGRILFLGGLHSNLICEEVSLQKRNRLSLKQVEGQRRVEWLELSCTEHLEQRQRVYVKKGCCNGSHTTPINRRNNSLAELNMVTARLTDVRSSGYSSSGAKRSEVPLKR